MKSIAIITASYGGVDKISPAMPQTVACDFHCFGCDAEGWQVHDWAFCRNMPPVYIAKAPKILPELILPQKYLHYIWLDGSLEITNERFAESALDEMDGQYWLSCRHSKRTNVRDEVVHSLAWERYRDEPLNTQYGHYLRMGFEDRMLAENGWFVRASTQETQCMAAQWMAQILMWSCQDQVSLPFVWWMNDFEPAWSIHTAWSSPYHRHKGHAKAKHW